MTLTDMPGETAALSNSENSSMNGSNEQINGIAADSNGNVSDGNDGGGGGGGGGTPPAGPTIKMVPNATMGVKKKMSAPPKMIEEQTRGIRERHNNAGNNKLNLKIPVIQEEGGDSNNNLEGGDANGEKPGTAGGSASSGMGSRSGSITEEVVGGENIEYLRAKTDILPWNIVEDPPLTTKAELYPIEGSWRLISNQNYDKYLASIGVTPLMAQMVLRSDFMITIYEDIDKCWKILTETSIKAKSIKGYKCRNYKMTSNKFLLDDAKPELLDDWDPRLVVTTLTFDEEQKNLLVWDQVAEKDQKYHMSSRIAIESQPDPAGDPSKDVLVMTCETADGKRAIRRLVRHIKQSVDPGVFVTKTSRKISAPF